MENHFVGNLKELGYNAVSSLQEYGSKAFDKMEEESPLGKLKNSGVDAVITIVLHPIKKKKENIFPAILPMAIIITVFWAIGVSYTAVLMNWNIMLPTPNIFGKVIFMI